ncbi:MAG TPA: VOC family protein [Acidimicrobiia bacterium]|nr:VOC family protein [Acidimicrobiia bacterium]
MPIHRLNHAVLYVSDVERSVRFYEEVLGFRKVMGFPGAAFMQAPASQNDHDLGLFQVSGATASTAGRSTVGLYHLAWEVDTLGALEEVSQRLLAEGAMVGATDHGTTKALYGRDPDGIEFEVCWLVPAELITDEIVAAKSQMKRLDLEAEKNRYGADTLGGIGVSISSLVR